MIRQTPTQQALVVDDSASDREILSTILKRQGLEVTPAADGMTALTLITMRPKVFDVIFVDMVMDDVHGIDLIRRIRSHTASSQCPIVPMSATMTRTIARQCWEAGGGPLTLPKPFRRETIQLVLELLRLGPTGRPSTAGRTHLPTAPPAVPTQNVGALAHEFNNLLGIIIGSIDIALENSLPGDVRSSLVRAADAALRGAEISASLRRDANVSAADVVLPDPV